MKNIKEEIFCLLCLAFLLVGGFCFVPKAFSQEKSLFISEVAVGVGSSSNEFIEIYNASSNEINLDDIGIKLKIVDSSGKATQKTISWVNKIIPPRGFFLFGAGSISVSLDATYGGTLMTGKGGVVISKGEEIVDEIYWESLKTNQSFERKEFEGLEDKFSIRDITNPGVSQYIEPDPAPEPIPDPSLEPEPTFDPPSEDLPVPEIKCRDNSMEIKISEIYPNTEDEKNEFVEIVNTGLECADISGWAIKDSTNTLSHKTIFPENTILDSGRYFYIQKKLYLNNDSDTVFLLDKTSLEKDHREYKNAIMNKAYGFDGQDWQWTSKITPGEENKFDSIANNDSEGVGNNKPDVYLNEILPNADEEYIEIYNAGPGKADLSGWTLKDASKKGKYKFPEKTSLGAKRYIILYKKDFKFALNNSGKELVILSDNKDREVSRVEFNGAKKNVSYNFDGQNWRWSKFKTPKRKNKFNSLPQIKVDYQKKLFKNVSSDFKVHIEDENRDKHKIIWDFGDGHKSYQAEASHTYKKSGSYRVTLKVNDGSEEVAKSFKVKVSKFPKAKISIVALAPNPESRDSDFEWIVVRNDSKKKANLKGWSVATGWDKLINHPLQQDLILKPGESQKITRDLSKFVLGNEKTKVELRYPDGKTADKLSYNRESEAIEEGEILEKNGNVLAWKKPSKANDIPVDSNQEMDQKTSLPGADFAGQETEAAIAAVENNSAGSVLGIEKEKMQTRNNDIISVSSNWFEPIFAIKLEFNALLSRVAALF